MVNPPRHKKWLVVDDGRGRMRSSYRGNEDAGTHVLRFVSHGVPADYLAFLRSETIPYLTAGQRRADLPTVMEKMKSKLSVGCLMSMAGRKLAGALLRAGLVNEANVLFAPRLIGGFETPSLFDSPDLAEDEWPTPLALLSVEVRA